MSAQVTFNFAGKAALIVGGTSGIGWATARAFAGAGAKVAVCGLAPSPAPEFDRQLKDDGAPDALVLPLDVRSAPDVERAVATVADRFGGFEIAINNAGVEGPFVPLIVPGRNISSADSVSGAVYNSVWEMDIAEITPAG